MIRVEIAFGIGWELPQSNFITLRWWRSCRWVFAIPGTGKSGDLPPRKECSNLWHQQLFSELEDVKLTLLVGNYAQDYVLKDKKKRTLTETVKAWKQYSPRHLPLPHPSPRNNRWLAKNPWFLSEVLPYLKKRMRLLLTK